MAILTDRTVFDSLKPLLLSLELCLILDGLKVSLIELGVIVLLSSALSQPTKADLCVRQRVDYSAAVELLPSYRAAANSYQANVSQEGVCKRRTYMAECVDNMSSAALLSCNKSEIEICSMRYVRVGGYHYDAST
ncbi:hypothetical protein Tco_0973875 [Tanacetum coccineum]|uniref:Uncharacterized protein n=1 Tax=Tanacetum coccineum TaxID=301880 RepID=A0ABQ5E9Y7_9ASTR